LLPRFIKRAHVKSGDIGNASAVPLGDRVGIQDHGRIQDALNHMDKGELFAAAAWLDRAARFLMHLEAAPRERAERNRKRRERRKARKAAGEQKGDVT